jgi:hypothetical protein
MFLGMKGLEREADNLTAICDIALCSPRWFDVSEESIASIFRVENQPSKKPRGIRWSDDRGENVISDYLDKSKASKCHSLMGL